jgi:hypothetical protein
VAHQSAIREGLMKPVLQLFDQIMALKGFRQVTVATSYLGARTYDVSELSDGIALIDDRASSLVLRELQVRIGKKVERVIPSSVHRRVDD